MQAVRDQLGARWSTLAPLLALVVLVVTWGADPGGAALVFVSLLLAAAVLSAVHHAEVVAHRVGEPFGSLVLAIAVTVIEVGLIVTLMVSTDKATDTLARDTVFAAVMITCNGIIGLSILLGALRERTALFNAEGSATAFGTVDHARDALPRPADVHDERHRARVLLLPARVRGHGVRPALRALPHRPDGSASRLLPAARRADAGGRARGASLSGRDGAQPRPAAGGSGRGGRPREDRLAGDRGRGRGGRRPAIGGGRRDRVAGAAARDARRRAEMRAAHGSR